MIQSPIRRKNLQYPKDFLPGNNRSTANSKRFTFNQQYQIEAHAIQKYSSSIQDTRKDDYPSSDQVHLAVNPQTIGLTCHQLEMESPLGHHIFSKKPDIDKELLKKPRFSLNNDEISESYDQALQNSNSPGSIRRQLENRQPALPSEDPCKIELVKISNTKIIKKPDSIIKFKSSAEIDSKKWLSSEREILQKFSQSRIKKSMNQLPSVSKNVLNKSYNLSQGKQIYQNFRKRQQSHGQNFGKMNNFLMSMKHKQSDKIELPKFEQSGIDKLKEQINIITKAKKKIQQTNGQQQKNQEDLSQNNYNSKVNFKKSKQKKISNKKIPEFLVSYRSSLSYLKDLYSQCSQQSEYNLTVKIPKLFTEKLIYKNQQKEQLYEMAKSIFNYLKIPHQNIIIKRYTNCTMIISRNICLIWYFDGKRYLGGWQTEYLDEGFKHGLGLEWQPKQYVYYGEFIKNKREGLGVYKDRNETVYIGYWRKGKRLQGQDDHQEEDINDYNMNQYCNNQYGEQSESQEEDNNYQYF